MRAVGRVFRAGGGVEGMEVANMTIRIVSEVRTIKIQDWRSGEKLGIDI